MKIYDNQYQHLLKSHISVLDSRAVPSTRVISPGVSSWRRSGPARSATPVFSSSRGGGTSRETPANTGPTWLMPGWVRGSKLSRGRGMKIL